MATYVTQVPATAPANALVHFEQRLAVETDCWDVNASTTADMDFVLLDVRGPEAYARAHLPAAINVPHGKITANRMKEWPANTMFVVYCAGPHCNGANRAAVRLAHLGLKVKEMIGGMTGWADEGFEFVSGTKPGGPAA